MILVTGGAGFIGSNFIHSSLESSDERIVNLDKLTYAGNLANLASLQSDSRYSFVRGDICDASLVRQVLARYRPRAIVHFAAETHVDRSILGPGAFVQTNVVGTHTILEEARTYWDALPEHEKGLFRFLHISTDEVYGDLQENDQPFREDTAYAPNSPYAASKAGSDHLVRAYHHTYGLPTLTTNCSNNYGPYQFPEKLIPLILLNTLLGTPLPVYGDGRNVRDWLYVEDHAVAIRTVLAKGRLGHTYNIGGNEERRNIEVVRMICSLVDELRPSPAGKSERLIRFVKDRPGHDRRYAIDAERIRRDLGWRPKETFESGLRKTVTWYLANPAWIKLVQSGEYKLWVEQHYKAG